MLAWHSSLIDRLSLVVRGSRSVVYGEVPSKWSVGTTAPSLQSHSSQQPSQRPDLRGISVYEHGVVPLPVLFTLEALTMPVTRYSKQDQADHGKSRWSNLRSELGHFLLHSNPRRCIWKVGNTLRLYSLRSASSGTLLPHRRVFFLGHEKLIKICNTFHVFDF